MGKKQKRRYTIKRASLAARLRPAEGKVDFRRRGKEVYVNKLVSEATTIESAEKRTREIVEHYKKRIAQGESEALGELISDYPLFNREPWVQQAYRAMAISLADRKRPRFKRGQGRGRGALSPIYIKGLVDVLVKSRRMTKHRAFKLVKDGLRLNLTVERIERLYQQGTHDERFRPFLVVDESSAEEVDEEELSARLNQRLPNRPPWE